MSVKVTLEFDNVSEMLAHFSKTPANGGGTSDKQGKPAKNTDAAPTQPTAPATTSAQPSKESSSASKAKIYSDTPLAGLINDCVKAGKMAAAKELLKEFGVEKGPQLKPEQFDDAEAKFKALLAAPAESLG